MTVEEMATFKSDVSTLGYGNLTKPDSRNSPDRVVDAPERCRVF